MSRHSTAEKIKSLVRNFCETGPTLTELYSVEDALDAAADTLREYETRQRMAGTLEIDEEFAEMCAVRALEEEHDAEADELDTLG